VLPLYNLIALLAVIASATIAVLHGSIGPGVYTSLVAAALGIGGVVHVANGNGKPKQ